jgi:hypothetical protein
MVGTAKRAPLVASTVILPDKAQRAGCRAAQKKKNELETRRASTNFTIGAEIVDRTYHSCYHATGHRETKAGQHKLRSPAQGSVMIRVDVTSTLPPVIFGLVRITPALMFIPRNPANRFARRKANGKFSEFL